MLPVGLHKLEATGLVAVGISAAPREDVSAKGFDQEVEHGELIVSSETKLGSATPQKRCQK